MIEQTLSITSVHTLKAKPQSTNSPENSVITPPLKNRAEEDTLSMVIVTRRPDNTAVRNGYWPTDVCSPLAIRISRSN